MLTVSELIFCMLAVLVFTGILLMFPLNQEKATNHDIESNPVSNTTLSTSPSNQDFEYYPPNAE